MTAIAGRRDDPVWTWALADPGRIVISVVGGPDVLADELADRIAVVAARLRAGDPPDAVPPDDTDVVSAVVLDLASAVATAVDADELDARARLLVLATDAAGFTAGGTVVVLLPLRRRATLDLVAGLVHSGRRTCLLAELSAAGLARALEAYDVDDVVTTREAVERLAGTALTAGPRAPERVVALGPIDGDALRVRLAEKTGRDLLVEVGPDGSGADSIAGAAGAPDAGFWSWAAGRPGTPAVVVDDGTSRTAGELLDRARRLAGGLPRQEPGSDHPPVVVAVLPDQVDLLTAYLAASWGGFHVVPAASGARADEIAHFVRTAGADAVLTSATSRAVGSEAASSVPWPVAVHDIGELFAEGVPGPAAGPAGGLLPYTSGTTGAPKLVRQPAGRVSPQLRAAWEAALGARIGIAATGAHLVAVPLHQPAALTTASFALHAGQTLVLLRRWSPRAALEAMCSYDVTSAFFVPSMFDGLLALPESVRRELTPRSLVAAIHSTAACPVPTKHAMLDWWGPVLYERYGATEAPGTYVTPREWLVRPGTVGRPFPGVRVTVLDDAGHPCGPGVPGRVHLADAGAEYVGGGAPDRAGGFVSVGDVGYLDAEGWLFLVGRETDYVSVGGAKFHPSEVERVLAAHPDVAEVAVVPVAHARLGQVPVAYVVLVPGITADSAVRGLGAFAREQLPPVRRPVRFRVIPELPRNAAGKVLRHELAADRPGP